MNLTSTIPVLLSNERLTNMFGCVEMEEAAFRIMKKVIRLNSWEITVDCSEFIDDANVLDGFVMLVAYQWIYPDYPNGSFILSKEFIDRINLLLPIDVTRRHLVSKMEEENVNCS
jgi:hypothetical protein